MEMLSEYRGRGVIVYEAEQEDQVREAVVALARLNARGLDDAEAAGVSALFEPWLPGKAYRKGERITDGAGCLYRVEQDHTAQEDWPLEHTPALYTALGVNADDPDAIPAWRQPTGAQDAYQKGDRVRWQGKVYMSQMDGNVWAPDVTGWQEATDAESAG